MGNATKIKKIHEKCKRAKVVSFDIFGTLVVRDIVDPDDIFVIADRKKSEKNISLKDCNRNELLECELSLDHPNENMIALLTRLKSEHKTVILTSDMYLNEQALKEVLNHVGIKYKEYYDKIFVSCDYGCTKKNGGLYKKIKELYKVEYSEIVHIGDALRSDFLMPTILGIKAVWIKPEYYGTCSIYRKKDISNLNRFITNHTKDKCYEYNVGYKYFGPLLYGFALWLDEHIPHDGKKVYFLAREGYTFLKALEKMGLKRECMHYLLVSRRSINNALLWTNKDATSMILNLGIDREISYEKILNLLNITDKPEKKLLETMYRSSKEIIEDTEAYEFISEKFEQIVIDSKKQYEMMKCYFESMDFNGESDCIIVDVGWAGTMQQCLNRYLKTIKSTKRVKGLYLGVHTNNYHDDDKEGFLFDGDSVKKQKEIFSFVGMLESFLSEQIGSVRQYCSKDGRYEAERCSYEYDDMGKVKISQVQEGMLAFVEDMFESDLKEIMHFDSVLSKFNLISYGNNPGRKDLNFYRALNYKDDSYNLKSEVGLKKLSVRDLKNGIMNSIWKTAYLKSIFGIWFPAKCLYDLIYELKKNK